VTPQEELTRYFEVCGYSPDDLISIVTRKGADGPLFWSFTPVSEAPRQIAARKGINCWFSANPMQKPADRESRGTTADVVAVRALWADLDVKPGGLPDRKTAKEVMKGLASLLGVDPCAIVWSGHGFQPRWRVDIGELHTPERMAPVIERFGELVKMLCGQHGGKADSVYDMPRIIRAPHTMNIKPELEPVPTKVWLYPDAGTVTFERLVAVLDEYVPARQPIKRDAGEDEIRHVGMERGDAYVSSAVDYIRAELASIADWEPGRTDDKGRGWEKVQADAAFRLASLAKADWNSLDLERAQEIFTDACPTDDGWTIRDVIKKWKSQVRRAEPAEPPADSDDPLAGGGVAPHRSAAVEAAIWGGESRTEGLGAADTIWGPVPESEPGEAGADHGVHDAESDGGGGGLAAASPPVSWRKYSWDDFGNADRTVELLGDTLRYSPAMKRWLRYEGGAWRETETGGEKAVQEMLRGLFQLEGPLYSDVEYPKTKGKMTSERTEFGEWWTQQRAAAKVSAAAKVIRNDGLLDASPAEFDAQPMLLNCPNGVVDLASGELLEHDPRLMLRRQVPIDYESEAKAPRWEAFLETVQPSADMRDYLQRIVGYTITGSTKEQVVFFHVGPPASGKSVFLDVLNAMLGEFAGIVPSNTLLNKKMENHPADIMSMEGRRMLALDETPEGARLDESLIKRLSGETKQTARGMGENWREFKLVGKVHLVTNHDPHISDDQAMHRRLHYIPWRHQIPVEERIQGLAELIICEELEGVLAWAVRGARRWREDHLNRPAEAEMARSAYLAAEDEFAVFIDEELIVGAENAFTASKEVYRRYRQWCESQGMKPMSAVAFGRKLSRRGVEASRTREARGFKCFLQQPRWVQDPLSG
jgi:putative DNA primase/helicase